MIAQIEKANPDYVIFVREAGSWLRYPESSTLIFDGVQKYQAAVANGGAGRNPGGRSRLLSLIFGR